VLCGIVRVSSVTRSSVRSAGYVMYVGRSDAVLYGVQDTGNVQPQVDAVTSAPAHSLLLIIVQIITGRAAMERRY